MAKTKISKKVKLSELIEKHPQTIEILINRGLHCFGCALAAFETLEDGARAHGMNDQEIERLIEEINQVLEQETEKKRDQGTEKELDQ